MHARHYNPVLGRFIQPDPSGAEANLYAYATNSPVTNVDPSGLYDLNPTEAALCERNPQRCWEFKWAAAWAKTLTDNRYHGTQQNAMRHCVWQCLMQWRSGWYWADRWASAHEDTKIGSASEARDRVIDYHNNAVGRSIGRHDLGWFPAWQALNSCADAYNAGRLWIEVNNRIFWSDGRPVRRRDLPIHR